MNDSVKLNLAERDKPKNRIVVFNDAAYRITADDDFVYFEYADKDRLGAVRWSPVDGEYAVKHVLRTLVKNELSLARNRGENV